MAFALKSKLPRLAREFYQGHVIALWTHTMENRATGWLDEAFHHQFREILLHTCHRYAIASPCYVLMPDHWHVVWTGLRSDSDQWLAAAFLRKHLRRSLGAARLQDRAHDHVLRESELERRAFHATCAYVCLNPERAGLCSDWHAWPHLGAMVPGYPEIDPRQPDFWDAFWNIHNRLVENDRFPALTRRATNETTFAAPFGPLRKERDRSSAHLGVKPR